MSRKNNNPRAMKAKQQKNVAKSKRYSDVNKKVLLASGQKSLPLQTRKVIDTVWKFLDKPFILKKLNHVVTSSSNMQRRVRDRIRKVIITLVSFMDWSTLNVGLPKSEYFDTVCHDAFMARYEKIFGEKIAKRSWERDIRRLKDADYFGTQQIITDSDEKKRGETCPKWFQVQMFVDLGLSFDDLRDNAHLAINALERSGLSNIWPMWVNKAKEKAKALADVQHNLPHFDTVPDEYETDIFPDTLPV